VHVTAAESRVLQTKSAPDVDWTKEMGQPPFVSGQAHAGLNMHHRNLNQAMKHLGRTVEPSKTHL
jgi:hypothetical protein